MKDTKYRLKILRLMLKVNETSAPYNQFSRALADRQQITLCTYFKSVISPVDGIRLFEGDGTLLGFFRTLKAALAADKYDIVHTHSPHVGLLFLIASLLFGTSTRSTVCTVHNSYGNFKFRNRLMFLPVFAFFRRTVCCGKASLASFSGLYSWLAGDRICAVQNGMDIDRVDTVIDALPESDHTRPLTILSIGRLINIKNPETLLAAFERLADPSARLVFAGGGPLRQGLLDQCRARGIEPQVEFAGLIPREDIYRRLLEANIFISTSHGEGLPIAVLEAMACRRPVILSDIPPHREIAGDTDFIPLVQPGDTAGFTRELDRLMSMSAWERAEIGRKCRSLVEERFSLTAMHDNYAEVYAQVATRPFWHEAPEVLETPARSFQATV